MTATAEATKAMEDLKIGGSAAPKGTKKRDDLRANEIKVQEKWEKEGKRIAKYEEVIAAMNQLRSDHIENIREIRKRIAQETE